MPMLKPIKMAGVELRNADNVLVRIETSDGGVGWGEAASAPSMTGETVESMMAAVRYLAAAVPSLDWGVSPTSPYLTEDVLSRPLEFCAWPRARALGAGAGH